jgi:hypothetical protein
MKPLVEAGSAAEATDFDIELEIPSGGIELPSEPDLGP